MPGKKSRKTKGVPLNIIEFVFDRWTSLIIREAFFGVHRFEQFHKDLRIARNVLSVRLQHLVETGIFEVRRYNRFPARFEYNLTEIGLDLYPFILALMQWGDRWLIADDVPAKIIYHHNCSNRVSPLAVCSRCGEQLRIDQITYEGGPRDRHNGNKRLLDSRRRKPPVRVSRIESICTVERTLNLIGDRWTFLILREALFGARRFEEFSTRLSISRNILTARLRNMLKSHIFVRIRYSDRPLRYEYRLSDRGIDCLPIILAEINWENKWVAANSSDLILLRHNNCGQIFEPIIVCAHCSKVVKGSDIEYSSDLIGNTSQKVL